jgi:phosphoenolpyruvate phosphomutase
MTQSQAGIQVANGPGVADGLRNLICSNHGLSFLMEAHGGMSAAVAERAGFEGPWFSGLSVSRSPSYHGAREASWTQLVRVVEHG